MNKVEAYIENHWDECIKENMETTDRLCGVPYPFTVPAIGHFDELYYWDTYFTNKGLELCGRWAQVKNNTDDMLYMVNRCGFMPNSTSLHHIINSQPPFLSVMVRDVFDHYKDTVWLLGAFDALLKEYDFWQAKRMSPVGLCCYGGDVLDVENECKYFESRAGFMPDDTPENIAKHIRINCESGWDCNPRWGTEGYNFAQIDLNSLLFMFETNMAYFASVLKNGREELWNSRAEKRRELIYRHMTDNDGIFFDYNFAKDSLSTVFSAASFFPLYAGLASPESAKATFENLSRLEAEYGILTCEDRGSSIPYQWDYPNGWACLQYIAIVGLDKYGYKEAAKRIAQKYVGLVEKVFDETGNLWEKYNVVEGNINVSNEYEMPPMMGWSAGVYLAARDYLK